MAETKQKYTAITPPAFTSFSGGLVNATTGKSAVLDNSTTLYVDIQVQVKFKTVSGTLGTTPALSLYVAGSADGTTFPDGLSAGDAAYTIPANTKIRLVGQIPVNAAATADASDVFSLLALYPGGLPQKFVFLITDGSGLNLSATAGDCALILEGVTYTTA